MELGELQLFMQRLFAERDKERGILATFVWLVEEVGELAEAVRIGDRRAVEEEIADVIAWTVSLANLLDINVEEAICRKYGCS